MIDDINRYKEYIFHATKSTLKNEVAGSYLGWQWWVLDPLLFMIVYTVVVRFIFGSGGPDFPVFVFIGLSAWKFFDKSVISSVKIVRSYKAIIEKVYVPKYVLILVNLFVNLVKMLISFLLVLVLMYFFQITYSPLILFFIPITMVLFVVTFAVCVISAHIGVFIVDFGNVLTVFLRLAFYLSGVLYSIGDRLPQPLATIMYHINPVSVAMTEYRNVIMYSQFPSWYYLSYWLIIGVVLSIIFVKIMYKYENTYVKVI